jgi:predicted NACHT family NTPase
MASRSLQACSTGVEQIAHALTHQKLSQEELGGDICQAATSKKFCRGEKVDRRIFVKLCEKLDLNWEEIAGITAQSIAPTVTIDASVNLVQKFRDRIKLHLQKRCGTMRVLDMSQPIGLDDIYTNVNILEKITGRRRLKLSELARNVPAKQVERFGLGDVREGRVPGLVAVEKYSKLMILGKPGAGKTTFLKHLAIQCIGGRFQPQQVPIFITLKEFAESQDRPDLLEYIRQYLESSKLEIIQELLDRGNVLILLDGLDEVRETDVSRVLRQIQKFSERYHHNQIVVTCRIAAREYTFEQFTEVEVADFDSDQIADFAGKWFRSREDEVKGDRFLKQLKAHPPIEELATSPLLLTLLCLVFEDSGEFPANRSELYQNGVDVLLKKWDVKRNIERDQIYKKLSLKRKEDLLSQIAYRTFEAANYFFKQKDLERQIREFIENLPGASTDEQELELDSEAVLKSIEAQHGLFVERARGIYSFSHLTFHEYFTAQQIVSKCNPTSLNDPVLNQLASNVMDVRWREVILLVVGMLTEADSLLLLMKQKVDSLIAENKKLQNLLKWTAGKSRATSLILEELEARFFYIKQIDNYYYAPSDIDRLFRIAIFDLALNQNSLLPVLSLFDTTLGSSIDIIDIYNPTITRARDTLETALEEPANNLTISVSFIASKIRFLKERESKIGRWSMRSGTFFHKNDEIVFEAMLNKPCDGTFTNAMYRVIDEIQNASKEEAEYQIADYWVKKFRELLIEHRNIGHNWQLSKEERSLLSRYVVACDLISTCLNNDSYISRDVRGQIESTLLLPIAEIQKLQSSESKP